MSSCDAHGIKLCAGVRRQNAYIVKHNNNDGVQTAPVNSFDCYQLITTFAVCRSCQFVSKPATSGMISEETKNDNIQKLIENAESQSEPPTVVAGEKASQMI